MTLKSLLEVKDTPLGATALDGYKKVYIREEGRYSTPDSDSMVKSYGGTIYGWLSTKYNIAAGYIISSVTTAERKEFGDNIVRISNEGKFVTTIGKIDVKKGKIIFLDDDAYEKGDLKFQSPMAFKLLVLDKEEYLEKIQK